MAPTKNVPKKNAGEQVESGEEDPASSNIVREAIVAKRSTEHFISRNAIKR